MRGGDSSASWGSISSTVAPEWFDDEGDLRWGQLEVDRREDPSEGADTEERLEQPGAVVDTTAARSPTPMPKASNPAANPRAHTAKSP